MAMYSLYCVSSGGFGLGSNGFPHQLCPTFRRFPIELPMQLAIGGSKKVPAAGPGFCRDREETKVNSGPDRLDSPSAPYKH